jgi:L-ascorbate metabolism protein UlaG (beta-lactamase superfamily)
MAFHADLCAPPSGWLGEAANDPIAVRWLGTAGFEIRYGAHVLLIDPYVTRASLRRCLVAPLSSDGEIVRAKLPRADAIVVGHTHFDHALDVPAIARSTGALVYGSRSAASLCRASGIASSRIVDVEEELRGGGPWESEIGPFHLRFFPSAHSRLVLGRVPFPGEIDDCEAVPMRLHHYKCGAVFGVEITVGGRTLHHLGSAELVEAALHRGARRPIDVLLLCVAGWTKSQRFPERALSAFSPRAILLSHWDDFFQPLDRAARPLPRIELPRFVDRLRAEARDVPIATLPLLGETQL